MHRLSFRTHDPFDHCARLLDIVRRTGFRLIRVCAARRADGIFAVTADIEPQGTLSPDTLLDRVANCHGTLAVELQIAPDSPVH